MRKIILVYAAFMLSCCTHQAPYELKSPCVSNDTDNLSHYNPCIRRPINVNLI